MVKLAKGAKAQGKPKKAPPPKEVEDSEEDEEMEEESSEEEVPVKNTPAKKAATPAKATPGKKAATPAKPVATPGKKATPAVAKNGKRAKQQESEDEEDSDDEEESEEETVAKKPAAKKPVAKKEESEEEEDDEEEDESEEEQKPVAKKAPAKKPQVKKPAKEESDEEESESEEAMEVTPSVAKGKKAAPAKKEQSEDDEEDDDEDDDDEEEDDDDDEEEDDEKGTKDSAKRKKDMPKNKAAPEAKKQKTEGNEGLSVFIANLNASKDYDELKDALREFFSKKSLPVQDVRIGASKRFGYVEFATAEEVEDALKLNGKKVLGFEVKIEKANTPAEKSKNAENKKERDARTLFVKNIPYSTTSENLQEIFDNAKDIRLPTAKDGTSKGIAYVEFATEAEADKAIEEKQGAEVEGRAIFVDYTGEKSHNAAGRKAAPGGESKVIVVNNLSYNATEDSLQEVFEKATSIRIPQNNQGRPKGFAFIEFPSVEEAKEALESCNNTEVEGRTIRLEYSQSGGSPGSNQSKTLFVRGLSEDTSEETLKEAFDGSVNARIVTDRDTGASKGFGFVDFSTSEDAKAAKEAMEDGEIDGNKVTLDFAKPKGEGQRGGGRGGFGGRGGGRGGFGGRGGGRGGFGGRGGGGRGGGFKGRGGGGFRGGNQGGQGKRIKFDD
ncbi:nucleolin isoform X3 [Rana temporaria]|uniref:nucleolin isoform X2 n=1 Tax=Rana temporaria TaxID=8407 RepID=UPI001AADD40D|nr:nucleolin isoform X2 [Rana temporaria]XP_040205638.1 nucleolin isoform X3 [Rana temporaria]